MFSIVLLLLTAVNLSKQDDFLKLSKRVGDIVVFIDDDNDDNDEDGVEHIRNPVNSFLDIEERARNARKGSNKEDEEAMRRLIEGFMGDGMQEGVGELVLNGTRIKDNNLRPNSRRRCKKDYYNKCGDYCHCYKRRSYCCRQRKDFDDLTHDERLRVLWTIRNIAMGDEGEWLQRQYYQLLKVHEDFWWSGIHDRLQFFPWHRIYLLEVENLLRRVDCRITIPYWDWTKNTDRWWRQAIFGSEYFGQNLRRNGGNRHFANGAQCVSTGVFSQFVTNFRDLQGQCLMREYSYNLQPPNYERIQKILAFPTFRRFEYALRLEHGVPHYLVGGEREGLMFTHRAAEDPLFHFHHSMVDYLWYQRQTRYPDWKEQYWGQSRRRKIWLTGLDYRIEDGINSFNLVQDRTCVEYISSDNGQRFSELKMKERKEPGELKQCSKQRRRFPNGIFHLFRDITGNDQRDFLDTRDADC